MRRESSYDLSSRISGTTIDSDSDTSNQGREGQEEEEEDDDGRTTPTAHRRKQILAKLGLNSKVSFSSRNEEITSVRSRSQSESNITRRISRARSGNGTRKGLGFIGSDSSLGVGDNWSSEEDEGRVLF